MVLPYRIVKHEPDEYGRKYIDIFITDGAEKDLAIMTVYLESNTRKHFKKLDKINISYVEKYDKNIKGCFCEFIKILISQTHEIFGHTLSNSTEELKKLYKANGFKNYDPKNPLFMVTTISKLKDVIGGKKIIDDPYKTPNESISEISPIRPVKPENQERISISEVPAFTLYIPPRYLRSTVSSRGKNVGKRVEKRGGNKKTRKQR